ncbi:MAG: LLM class F420-dependent oxidoreductase [Gammaproteobacteria bacterium]|nr:LLM class F420-dependent oxidoreductase [Gammaproteobacteria bacterium]
MRIATLMSYAVGFKKASEEIVELEKAGLDVAFVPEAYSFDAPTAMGYLAAKTNSLTIASGIIPIYTRTPTLLAMTAAGLDSLSDGRAMLGLGAGGPQVMEGFHGVPFTSPVARIREIIEVCRKVWKREEKLVHDGKIYQVPSRQDQGTGLGIPLKLINHPVRNDIPITIAALGQKSVELTAEAADGWLPAFYVASQAKNIWGDALARGMAKRDPNRAPLEVFSGGGVGIGEGLEHLRDMGRPQTALYVGGMGARGKNFYNDIFSRAGYEKEAVEIQDLYLSGKKAEAEAAIPKEFFDKTSLIGPEGFVRDRLAELKESGVTSLNVGFVGHTMEERLSQCENLRDIVDSL